MKIQIKTLSRCVSLALSVAFAAEAVGQTDSALVSAERPMVTQHSFVVGVGTSNILDTYLSPLEYKGTQFSLQRETFRMTNMAKGRIAAQSLFRLVGGLTDNRAETGNQLSTMLSYNIGWLYQFPVTERLKLYAGGLLDANLGAVYNTRGSNNPAQAKAFASITASGMATYRFRLAGIEFDARYQMFVPMVGVAFAPEYGQSYYEIFSLGNSEGTVHVTTPFTMPTMRHLLTLDFPVSSAVLRVGYMGNFDQTHISGLKWHSYSHSFVVGFVKTFQLMRSRKRSLPAVDGGSLNCSTAKSESR